MTVYSGEYSRTEDLDLLAQTILNDRPTGIFFWGDLIASPRRQAMCDFALKNRLPALGPDKNWTDAGCLISYASDMSDRYRRAAIYVDKILKGAKPGELPRSTCTRHSRWASATSFSMPRPGRVGSS
jgi:putative tryptophan/tyrosine transport system substrate-binding protein